MNFRRNYLHCFFKVNIYISYWIIQFSLKILGNYKIRIIGESSSDFSVHPCFSTYLVLNHAIYCISAGEKFSFFISWVFPSAWQTHFFFWWHEQQTFLMRCLLLVIFDTGPFGQMFWSKNIHDRNKAALINFQDKWRVWSIYADTNLKYFI